jgi:4-hydroxy-4-methyl-2-oxoglutarate aldolase
VSEAIATFEKSGVATVYESCGRKGLIDIPLVAVIFGASVAGPARTVRCGQDDNLMVHAVMDRLQAGEVLVLTMDESTPVALVGELLATQAKKRGAVGILVDAAVRDVAELRNLGLPVWARFVRVRGATKHRLGELDVPVTVGTGDIVVLDDDGGVVVRREMADEVALATVARLEKERAMRTRLESGELSLDIHDLRAKTEGR